MDDLSKYGTVDLAQYGSIQAAPPAASSETEGPPGAFSRFLSSAMLNPLPAIKEWWNRPEEIRKAMDALHVLNKAASLPENKGKPPGQWKQPPLNAEEQATVERGMTAGLPSSEGSNPLSAPLEAAVPQAMEGNLAGAAGSLVGGYVAPAVVGATLKGTPGAARYVAGKALPVTKALTSPIAQDVAGVFPGIGPSIAHGMSLTRRAIGAGERIADLIRKPGEAEAPAPEGINTNQPAARETAPPAPRTGPAPAGTLDLSRYGAVSEAPAVVAPRVSALPAPRSEVPGVEPVPQGPLQRPALPSGRKPGAPAIETATGEIIPAAAEPGELATPAVNNPAKTAFDAAKANGTPSAAENPAKQNFEKANGKPPDFEAAARAKKVNALADTMWGKDPENSEISADDAARLSPGDWNRLADGLGVNRPSPTSRAAVIEQLRSREAALDLNRASENTARMARARLYRGEVEPPAAAAGR
ncbi:MAG: hypothetical protein V4502_08130 [Pseudomonadota bacterium]